MIFFHLLCWAALAGAAQAPQVSDELIAKARLQGSLRVIVQLRIAASADDSRDSAIEATRRALLDELAPVAHRLDRIFTVPPALVLEASIEALQVLRKSAHVLRVDEDGLAAPSTGMGPSMAPIGRDK